MNAYLQLPELILRTSKKKASLDAMLNSAITKQLNIFLRTKSESGKALTETAGVVTGVPEPALVLAVQVLEVVIVLLVDGLAAECEHGPLNTLCMWANLLYLTGVHLRLVCVGYVDLQHVPGHRHVHLLRLVWSPINHVAVGYHAGHLQCGHGGDVLCLPSFHFGRLLIIETQLSF